MPGYHPPSNHGSPAPPAPKEDKDEKKKNDELESLKELIQKHEEARLLREQAMLKKAEEEAAAAAAKKAKEEEEKNKKEEIAAASKKAKEDAEKKAEEAAKKAKEEHEQKLKEAETAKAEAEKKQKELEETVERNKPTPDSLQAPIKFKDAVGRRFSFPWHLCKTWKGMETLIKQAFLHVDVIGEHVHQGRYDLTGPDGEIILPQVWDTMIKPDWEISMHMWPMPEPAKEKKKEDKAAQDAAALADPFASLGLADLGIVEPMKKKSSKKDKKKTDPIIDVGGSDPLPPPPNFPAGLLSDPLGSIGIFPPGIPPVVEAKKDKTRPKSKSKSSSSKEVPGIAAWFAGNSGRPKKDDEKFDLVRHRSASSKSSSRASADQALCVIM